EERQKSHLRQPRVRSLRQCWAAAELPGPGRLDSRSALRGGHQLPTGHLPGKQRQQSRWRSYRSSTPRSLGSRREMVSDSGLSCMKLAPERVRTLQEKRCLAGGPRAGAPARSRSRMVAELVVIGRLNALSYAE